MMVTSFIWQEHIREILWVSFLSMVPTFEGRYALTVRQALSLSPLFAYFLALVASTLPMFFIFMLAKPFLHITNRSAGGIFNRFAEWSELRAVRGGGKIGIRGLLGLFVFVAAPIPGAGVWTGTVISLLLGYDKPRSILCIVAGNAVACLIMTVAIYGFVNFMPV